MAKRGETINLKVLEKVMDDREVAWVKTIYPRQKPSTSTIERYADAYLAGEDLGPFAVEEGTNRLLDGKHRQEAIRLAQKKYDEAETKDDWFRPDDMVPVEYHTVPEGVPIKLYAASLSARHGDRFSNNDARLLTRELYEATEDGATGDLVAKWLGAARSTVYRYIADLIAKKRETQQSQIQVLHRLGWTQQEIGDAVGLSQRHASRILDEIPTWEKSLKSRLSAGIPVEEVAADANITVPLAWAIKFDKVKDDAKRMEELNINIQPYDVWHFQKCLDGFGTDDYPGRIPAHLVAHVLWLYTNPGDMVLDPMAGGGTTNDVCLAMGRGCYSYDAHPSRYDIMEHDMSSGWPERIKKASLVFWDPPYFSKKDDEYGNKSISSLSRDKYIAFFKQRFTEAKKLMQRGSYLAFLMSNWDPSKVDEEDVKESSIYIHDYANLLIAARLAIVKQIDCPLSTQQVHPDIVVKKRKAKELCRLQRSLLVCRA